MPSSDWIDQVRDRRADAGDVVIPHAGAVVRAAGAGAGRHVVEVGLGVRVEGRLHLLGAGAVEGGLAAQRAALVGDGEQGRPLRGAGARAADLDPAVARSAVVERVVDGESGRGRGVVSHVGVGPRRRLGDDARLIRGLRLVRARPATAAAPARLASIRVARAQRQRRAADGQNVWRGGRPRDRRAVVARRRDERHARLAEITVVGVLARELAAAPAHRDDAGHRRGVRDARQQVGVARRLGLDQHDLRPRRHRVGPLDVERLLELPSARRVGPRQGGAGALADPRDGDDGQIELGVERVQVGLDVRIVVGVDDRDRLARAVALDRAEAHRAEAVRAGDLGRRVGPRGRGSVDHEGGQPRTSAARSARPGPCSGAGGFPVCRPSGTRGVASTRRGLGWDVASSGQLQVVQRPRRAACRRIQWDRVEEDEKRRARDGGEIRIPAGRAGEAGRIVTIGQGERFDECRPVRRGTQCPLDGHDLSRSRRARDGGGRDDPGRPRRGGVVGRKDLPAKQEISR